MASSSDKKTPQATAIEPPPAPHIDGEAILTIFVHKSLKAASGAAEKNGSPYSDRKKLSTIGNRMLLAAYSLVLFDKKPMFSAEDLEVCLRHSPFLSSVARLTCNGLSV